MHNEVRLLTISGRVQGVAFRASMQRQALALGINGWVRNCHNGDVAACVCGTPEQVAAIIHWAQRGPSAAAVRHVHIEEGHEFFSGFTILPDASAPDT